MSKIGFALCAAVGVMTTTSQSFAEDFRIATTVYDLSQTTESGKPTAVSTSLTLFHHRKVYDYISSAGEVMIFDANARRFTILSTSRSLATTVEFDEIKHLMKVGRTETEKYIAQQQKLGTLTSKQVCDALKFQLAPEFEIARIDDKKMLRLSSPNLTYQVNYSNSESSDSVARYLDYADWMAQMNYLLNPQAMYPAARLELNKTLRKQKLFPTTVELRTRVEAEIAKRAKHSVNWELMSRDRNLITRWDALLKSDDVRKIPFRQYQEAVLLTDK